MSSTPLLPTTNNLCERCRVIEYASALAPYERPGGKLEFPTNNLELPLDFVLVDQYPGLPILAQSASTCDFCSLLRQSVLSQDITEMIQHLAGQEGNSDIGEFPMKFQLDYQTRIYEGDGKVTALVATIFFGNEMFFLRYSIETTPDSRVPDTQVANDCHPTFGLNHGHMESYIDQGPLVWMLDRLSVCDSAHGHGPPASDFCPKRLVDISTDRGCKLVEFASRDSPPPKYAALTYCWGDKTQAELQLTTTDSTLAQRLAEIREDEMSPVLRDAARAARALCIPYLWIDSLCIIQGPGGQTDWEEQCQQMGKVYSNAYVTLCPLSSSSCLQGFLARPKLKVKMSFRWSLNHTVGGRFTFHYCGPCVVLPPSWDNFDMDLYLSRWNTRGWVYQEQVMSRRLLWFGNSTVHFQCSAASGTYGHNYSLPSSTLLLDQIERVPPQSLLEIWTVLICARSLRCFDVSKPSLTRDADLLPSLSGIAELFHRRQICGRYVAGMWSEELWTNLPWAVIITPKEVSTLRGHLYQNLKLASEPTAAAPLYITPTWSWLCRRCIQPLIFHFSRHNHRYTYQFDHLEVSTTLAGTNPLGEISAGILTVVGRTLALQLIAPWSICKFSRSDKGLHRKSWWRITVASEYLATCYMDWYQEDDEFPACQLKMLLLGSVEPTHEGDTDHSTCCSYLKEEEAAVEGESPSSKQPDPDPDAVLAYGLVVHQAPGNPEKYVRVGAFRSEPKGVGGLRYWKTHGQLEKVDII